jgi:hypothetical protein
MNERAAGAHTHPLFITMSSVDSLELLDAGDTIYRLANMFSFALQRQVSFRCHDAR